MKEFVHEMSAVSSQHNRIFGAGRKWEGREPRKLAGDWSCELKEIWHWAKAGKLGSSSSTTKAPRAPRVVVIARAM